ncbi:uncharacterized protein LOC144633115 isoform X2 [Oculina patagonica]
MISEVSDKYLTDIDPPRDVDILSNHFKRAVSDLQEMTLGYDHLLKENQQLRKSLSKMNSDLDLNSKVLQCLERETRKAEERAREACSNAKAIEETANLQINECQRVMDERHAYVVALLIKLLSTEEEAKELRKQVEEGRKRNEELMCKLKELTQNFDQERRKSLQMSETIALQQNGIRTVQDLTNRYRELQFISQKLQMEKHQAVSELNELKSWAEALKARYDIMEKNKQQCQENYENVVVDCSQFKKQMQELQFQLSVSQRQEEYLKEENTELTRLAKKYQEQRDFYGEERKKAINEREEARKERDEITQRYTDVLKEKDEAVRRFLQESREFECQHESDTAEMQALRERLIRTEEELKFLKMERELSLKTKPSTSVQASGDSKSSAERLSRYDDEDDDVSFSNIDGAIQVPKLSRSSTDIVKSIKNRFYHTVQGSPSLKIPSKRNSQIRFAQLLSFLPYQALTPMACSSPGKSSLSELSLSSTAANVLNFDSSPAAPAAYDTVEDFEEKQQKNWEVSSEECSEMTMKVDSSDEWNEETPGRPFVIDDSITPQCRPRAYDLDRSKTPRCLCYNATFWALRRIP